MKWIGLTGSIASGKSTATEIIRKQGYLVVDADELSKQAVRVGSPILKQVVDLFGSSYLLPDGSLDRKKLGEFIFSHPKEKEKLEKLIHPFVQSEVARLRKEAESRGDVIAFYDVPLLFEKNLQSQFDHILLIASDENKMIERMVQRDHLSIEQAKIRLANQMPMAEKRKKASDIIENNSDRTHLENEILKFLKSVTTR